MTQPNAPTSADEELNRLLAGGSPSGLELDAVWARVRDDVVATEAVASGGWLQSLLPTKALGLLGAVGAAVAFFAIMPGDDGLRARGGAEDGPVLEATCGTATAPCTVGQPFFLRVHGADEDHHVQLRLVQGTRRIDLGPRLQVRADTTLAVPRKVVPEASDVDSGITIEMTATLEDGQRVSTALTLQVAP